MTSETYKAPLKDLQKLQRRLLAHVARCGRTRGRWSGSRRSNLRVKLPGARQGVMDRVVRVQEALVSGDLPPLEEWAWFDSTTRAANLSAFQACLPEAFEQEYLMNAFLDVEGARRWAGEVEVLPPR